MDDVTMWQALLGYAFVTVLVFLGLLMVVGAKREASARHQKAHMWDDLDSRGLSRN